MDSFLAFFSLFFSEQNQLWLMFFNAFISATLLPGSSEVLFSTLIYQTRLLDGNVLSAAQFNLWLVATLGNSLGSLVTYQMGKLLPEPKPHRYTQWALSQAQKYGVFVLFFSWLPLIGDLFCGIAGWLRFKPLPVALVLFIGKGCRYAVLLFTFRFFSL